MRNIHHLFNIVDLDLLGYTHRRRIKYIDFIEVSYEIIKYIEGSQLCKINKIINIDYRVHIVCISINKYFKE